MQIANTLNNSIRILFNPRIEAFKLFDFLMVKSDDARYIAQIVEIYDDKFDASQNVAKLKLFYQINENNEVIPYDNFTPNKECEISKVKQEEIESFINQDKETFIFGTNTKTTCALNLQFDFFNKNAVILADKIENACAITLNLAKKLSEKKNSVIIDTTGVLELDEAKKIKACKNFKIPLNYATIDTIFDRCLKDASLEFQAIGGQIINEIKKFAQKQEHGFIPFNLLTRVLIQQHKATPYPELKLLLVRLKKYQMDEIFAKTKTDKNTLFNTIENNPITIIDLSNLDSYWQKAYIEYIISDIEKEVYLITRINDETFDTDLINKIYNKKKNISFVPNVSYNYKKLPSVMQHCKNYILMPSLTQRTDFLDANFALCNLIMDGCIVFGENTDGFIYLAKDYELETQEKRKNYRKIALTMAKQEESKQNNDEDFNIDIKEENSDSANLIEELSNFEASQQIILKSQEDNNYNNAQETFEEIENPTLVNKVESEILENPENDINENSTEIEDEFQDINPLEAEENDIVDNIDETRDELIFQESDSEDKEKIDDFFETEENNNENLDNENKNSIAIFDEISQDTEEMEDTEEELNDLFEEENHMQDDSIEISTNDSISLSDKEITSNEIESKDEFPIDEIIEETDVDLSDDELDFFQMAQDDNEDNDEEEEKKDVDESENNKEEQEIEEKPEDDIDLNEIADNSIDNNFEEIINSKNQQHKSTLAVDEKIEINEEIINKPTQKENLPIFKEENKEEKPSRNYATGNVIVHKKYGRGTIVKTIKYEERQLLQIEFEQAGKKLLDPTVADIKLEQ